MTKEDLYRENVRLAVQLEIITPRKGLELLWEENDKNTDN